MNKFRATDSDGRFYLFLSRTVKIPEDVATVKAVWRQLSSQVEGCFVMLSVSLHDFEWHGFAPIERDLARCDHIHPKRFCKADGIRFWQGETMTLAQEEDNVFLIENKQTNKNNEWTGRRPFTLNIRERERKKSFAVGCLDIFFLNCDLSCCVPESKIPLHISLIQMLRMSLHILD